MSDFSWPDTLDALARGHDLDETTAATAMREMLRGEATPAQIAGFLLAVRTKGESVVELTAFLSTLIEMSVPVSIDGSPIDTCGTGGDRAQTVNISTMAALVCAGAGVKVAKHGNRAVSSACGSADLLDALGVAIELSPTGVAACVEDAGIGFMFAPAFHPGMRHVGPVRRELGVRTLFNLIAPLANPAGVRRQVVGVGDPAAAPKIAKVLARRGVERAMVFRGDDGLDELSTTGTSHTWEINSSVRESSFDPASVGIARASIDDLRGGSPADNARVCEQILAGQDGPVRDAVVLNAAAALMIAGSDTDMVAGLERARDSIDSGRAATALVRLREMSQRAKTA